MESYVLIYLLAANAVAFLVFGIDKWKAVKGRWRLRLGGTAYLEHTGWIKESDCRSCNGQSFGWNR